MMAGGQAAILDREVLKRTEQQDRRSLGPWGPRSHLAGLGLPASRLIITKRIQYLSHLSHSSFGLSATHSQFQNEGMQLV